MPNTLKMLLVITKANFIQMVEMEEEERTVHTTTNVYSEESYPDETECKYSFEECPQCQQTKRVLVEYQKTISADKHFTADSIFTDEYTVVDLLNDFHHCRQAHSVGDDENPNKFEMCHEFMINAKPSIQCHSANCQVLRRQYRRRRGDTGNDRDSDDYRETILLQIHCYLIHSMDITKLTRHERIVVESQSDPELKQKKVHQFMKGKSQSLKEIVGDTTNDKFVSNVDNNELKLEDDDSMEAFPVAIARRSTTTFSTLPQQKEYEYLERDDVQILNNFQRITDCNEEVAVAYLRDAEWNPAIALHRFYDEQNESGMDIGQNAADLSQNDGIYTNGVEFWYWNSDCRPRNALTVKPKYSNLKEEMVTAGHLGIKMWYDLVKLCETLLKVRWVQKIKANGNGLHIYGIKAGFAFALKWLLALKLYTDFDNLNHEFCDQFRLKVFSGNRDESILSIKKRNGRYFNMSKQLTECVQCFGQMLVGKKKRYYRGVSRAFVFSRFISRFHVPLSTSKSVCPWTASFSTKYQSASTLTMWFSCSFSTETCGS